MYSPSAGKEDFLAHSPFRSSGASEGRSSRSVPSLWYPLVARERRANLQAPAGSMWDSEEYSSAEDEDYVPSGGEYSEDDVSELVKEDEDEEKPHTEKGKKRSKGTGCRKRKRGGLLLVPGEREKPKDQQSDSEEKEEANSTRQVKGSREEEEEEKKKKEDALWASFLSDVGQKSKAPAAVQVTSPQTNKVEEMSVRKFQEEAKEPEKPKDVTKVTITKVFDFAGEEVRVTKEVNAASKEAKSFLQQQEKEKLQPVAPTSLPTVSGVKRPSGMSSLLGKIGSKKQKMSTLEKSKLDWENFKEEEGIGEDLAIHNRGKEGCTNAEQLPECNRLWQHCVLIVCVEQ
uniref:Craniofacial development protein 1 n=1 Tax=Pelusios castaneus TaxID=367368 RepID=A0A8C8RHK2_9SAUR